MDSKEEDLPQSLTLNGGIDGRAYKYKNPSQNGGGNVLTWVSTQTLICAA